MLEEYPEEYGHLEEGLRKASLLRYRDILHETVVEYNRCGEFVRVFPCKHSKPYEKYFSGVFGTRMLNRIVHKTLFSNELFPYERSQKQLQADGVKLTKQPDPKNLKYAIDGVPQE